MFGDIILVHLELTERYLFIRADIMLWFISLARSVMIFKWRLVTFFRSNTHTLWSVIFQTRKNPCTRVPWCVRKVRKKPFSKLLLGIILKNNHNDITRSLFYSILFNTRFIFLRRTGVRSITNVKLMFYSRFGVRNLAKTRIGWFQTTKSQNKTTFRSYRGHPIRDFILVKKNSAVVRKYFENNSVYSLVICCVEYRTVFFPPVYKNYYTNL